MSMQKLSDQFYVGPQIEIDDIEDIQISGIKSIICLRPDGEGVEQPSFNALRSQAATLGLTSRYLPIVPGQISEDQIAEFADMVANSPGPVSPIAAVDCALPPFGPCIAPKLGNLWMRFLQLQNLLGMI